MREMEESESLGDVFKQARSFTAVRGSSLIRF